MSQNSCKRMLKNSDSAENELWNQTYRELKAEKEQLPEKRSQNGRFELAKNQSGSKKEPLNKALNLNGGNDEARTRDLMRDRHAL